MRIRICGSSISKRKRGQTSALLQFTLIQTGTTSSQAGIRGSTIAVIWHSSPVSTLYVVSPDGKNRRKLGGAAHAGLAIPSPDGSMVAFITSAPRPRKGRPHLSFWGGSSIWVVPSGGGKAVPISKLPMTKPTTFAGCQTHFSSSTESDKGFSMTVHGFGPLHLRSNDDFNRSVLICAELLGTMKSGLRSDVDRSGSFTSLRLGGPGIGFPADGVSLPSRFTKSPKQSNRPLLWATCWQIGTRSPKT